MVFADIQEMADTKVLNDPKYVIGLMSGTSADSIDAALVKTDGQHLARTDITISHPYRPDVAQAIYRARSSPETFLSDTDSADALSRAIAEDHAEAVRRIARMADTAPPQLVGFHGQTIYHNPEAGQTVQLGDGGYLAQLTSLPVIYDFRAADMAAGGQGAPLAPIYHQMLLMQAGCDMPAVFINIGGVANLSYCDADGYLEGYDIGPGNGLIDDLAQYHFSQPFDEGGQLAAQGQVDRKLVTQALSHSFFSLSGPRSLDRGAFEGLLARPEFTCLSAHDQIATATAFTSKAIAHAVSALPKRPRSIIVAGGGIHNNVLMAMLRDRLGDIKIETADAIGAPPDMVEAELIGFLAARYIYRLPASFPRTTGAESPQICGRIIYPE